jgi:EmrB/QacA subfamily drug resistance transporter
MTRSGNTVDTRATPTPASPKPAAGPAPGAAVDPNSARRWWILAVVGISQLMVILDVSIVNIALPSAQRDLGFSNDQRQWVVTAYALAFGSLLLLGGRLADLFGRKRTLLIGLAGFAAASAVGGAATGFTMLVIARAVQGMFGALLAPSILSLLTTTFTEPRERGRAFGIYGAIAGTGGAVGLLLGGVLTEYLDWRWCMYVNLIFAAVALTGATILLRHTPSEGDRPRLDLPGTVSVAAGLFSLVYGFSNAETHAWSAPGTWAFLLAGVVLLAVFVLLQTRVSHPLLPMRVLLDRDRGGSYLTIFLAGAGLFGIFLFLTYYLQQNLDFSPVKTGLAFLPMVAAVMITSTTASTALLPRFGPRLLIGPGMLVASGGMFWLTAISATSSYAADILGPLVIIGLGLGLAMAPAMNTATSRVRPDDAGVASATANVGQQVGGSIGTALFSSIAASAVTSYLHGRANTPAVLAHAAIHSYTTVFTWAAVIFAVGGVVCGLLLRPGRPDSNAAAGPAPAL